MSKPTFSDKINELFAQENWQEAQLLLMARRKREPRNHWVLTQLAVTYYEQTEYLAALELLLESYKIVPDCPLTLWNYAGAQEALGKASEALSIYTWLLRSTKTAEDDSCWESPEWTATLKADCVYRIGGCFERLKKTEKARNCYEQYIQLLGIGIQGLYSFDDARARLASLTKENKGVAKQQHAAFKAVLSSFDAKRTSKETPAIDLAGIVADSFASTR